MASTNKFFTNLSVAQKDIRDLRELIPMSIFQDEDTHNKQGKPEQDSYQHSSEDAVQHEKEPANPVKSTDVRKSHVKECENRTSRNAEIARQEMRKSHVRECENRTSGDAEIARQDMRKSHANNTDINNTELSNTDISYTHFYV